MSGRSILCIGLIVGCGLVVQQPAAAQQPLGTGFTYQGRLNQAGQPFNGPANLLFDLYDADVGGNPLGSHAFNGVAVSGGLFTVELNAAGEFGPSAFTGERRWLEISVNGTPLSPRQELTAGPYALFSKDGAQLAGRPAPFYLDAGNLSAGALGPAHGGTGIDTSAAASGSLLHTSDIGVWSLLAPGADAQVLTLAGGFPTWGDPSGFALPYNATASVDAPDAAFKVTNVGTGWAVWGQSDSSVGFGVRGSATSPTGFAYGGYFTSASPDGRAVFGQNTATTGPALGGRFGSAGTSGRGVYATASAATGNTFGGYFESLSGGGGIGVFGYTPHFTPSATTYGVYGRSDSAAFDAGGVGVFGLATATFNPTYGVWGENYSSSGVGVIGRALATSGTTYGVYGLSSSASGWGVWAQGRLGASGTKSSRIDHPDDPANKYLLHYAAESPEVINFYSETVTLDDRGEAVVELPHYFAKINIGPRYQLTAVGAPMPMLHVAEEIDETALSAGEKAGPDEAAPLCSFRIAGGAPGAKVSWEVKALRNDLWVRQRGAPVEVDKQDLEKGTYQHPELYGQPLEKGLSYDAERGRQSLDQR